MRDVNIKGIIYGSSEAIKIFQRQGYGVLVNLGSVDSEIRSAVEGGNNEKMKEAKKAASKK